MLCFVSGTPLDSYHLRNERRMRAARLLKPGPPHHPAQGSVCPPPPRHRPLALAAFAK